MLREFGSLVLSFSTLLIFVGCNDASTSVDQVAKQDTDTAPNGEAPEASDTAADTEESAPAEMKDEAPAAAEDGVITFSPGPNAEQTILEELIQAEEGDVFQFEEGVYELTQGLSLTVNDVTIRGRGMDKTILSFKNQTAGAEGLYITSDNVTVEDLAIEDTKGNAMKSLSADNIVLRRIRTEWTGGPKSSNGAYGLYPVSSKNVLVEECVAIGASDAGIYVGQSMEVIVRNCRAEFNVAGIEIENCYRADVYGCVATNNTGGILVFDLPDLPQQHGHDVRVFKNRIFENNTDNFAPEGNIVGTVAAGTGIMVMSNTNVEIFENEIKDHATISVLLISYLMANIEIKDANYYPYTEQVHVHHNTFGASGNKPDGQTGAFIQAVAGMPVPDIIWDGVINEEKAVDGVLAKESGISIHDNTKTDGELTFANLGGIATLTDIPNAKVLRDLSLHAEPQPAIAPAVIPGVE